MCAPSHKVVGHIFATKACIDNRKKSLLNSHTFSTCLHSMVNFRQLMAEIGWRVWGTPANFNGFACNQVLRSPILAASLHGTRAVGVSQTLRRGTRNGITELSLLVIVNIVIVNIARAAITLGIGPHSSFYCQCRSVPFCSVTSQLFCIHATRYNLNPKTANNIANSFVRSKLDF